MTSKRLVFTLIFLATVVGFFVRLIPSLNADFPLNDDGLFYVMIRDIQQNGYALPWFTSYNDANLPSAYPPLAFYVTGLLADLTRADLLDFLPLLPAFISGLCVLAFYS